jgi:hypothetical protein
MKGLRRNAQMPQRAVQRGSKDAVLDSVALNFPAQRLFTPLVINL